MSVHNPTPSTNDIFRRVYTPYIQHTQFFKECLKLCTFKEH